MRHLISLVIKTGLALCAATLLIIPAHAQISYDDVIASYFVNGDVTINTDISDKNVYVGKDNRFNFATQTGPYTLTVDNGAKITESGFYNTSYPFTIVGGLLIFGGNKTNIIGGSVGRAWGQDTSVINISGGTVEQVISYHNSMTTISGGRVMYAAADNNGVLDITGGLVGVSDSLYGGVSASGSSTVNIRGGNVENASISDASSLNISGGAVKNVNTGTQAISAASAINISGGAVDAIDGYNAKTIDINNGQVGYVHDIGNSTTTNIRGGAVNQIVTGGTLNVSGGDINSAYVLNSVLNTSGGRVKEIDAEQNSVVNVSGGVVDVATSLYNDSTATFVVSGGAVGQVILTANATAAFAGTNLTTTLQKEYAIYGNYSQNIYYDDVRIVREYQLGGTLTSGDSLTTYITAGGYTGDSASLSFVAPTVADNLYLTDNAAVSGIYNNVTVGQNQDGSVQTSPNVSLENGAFLRDVNVHNSSSLLVNGGTVNHSLNSYDASTINIRSGTLSSGVFAFNASSLNVSGGNISYVAGFDTSITSISGGNVYYASGYGASTINISGGVISEIDGSETSTINVTGGSILDVFAYDSSVFNLYGGTISANTIYRQSDVATLNFFGKTIDFSNAMAGFDNSGNAGVFYNTAWTQTDGTVVDTRYFNFGGDVSDTTLAGVTFNGATVTVSGTAAAPEPGTLALVALILPAIGLVARRRQ